MSGSSSSPKAAVPGKILVALSGGIACYKIAALVSRLVQSGCEVRCAMTESATRFIGPLTLQSLSGHPVQTGIWGSAEHPESEHVALARWADLMVLAPASANTLASIAHGLCGNAVSLIACALPRKTPVLFAPAMNEQMWENPITQANVDVLKKTLGWEQVGPEAGWQACRTTGSGRMSEPEAIFEAVMRRLKK